MSALKLVSVDGLNLHVEGVDLLDQTPVLDIKPYVTYCDAFADAYCGYVSEAEHAKSNEEDIFGQESDRLRHL